MTPKPPWPFYGNDAVNLMNARKQSSVSQEESGFSKELYLDALCAFYETKELNLVRIFFQISVEPLRFQWLIRYLS